MTCPSRRSVPYSVICVLNDVTPCSFQRGAPLGDCSGVAATAKRTWADLLDLFLLCLPVKVMVNVIMNVSTHSLNLRFRVMKMSALAFSVHRES